MVFNRKLKKIEDVIENADSYAEYREASLYHDSISGADDWKAVDKSSEYDYQLIHKRVSRMKFARSRNDAAGLMSILHEGIHGNLGSLANPELGKHAKIGTKILIQDFFDEVCKALDFIFHADENEVDFYEKLSFFDETTHAYGQSCLMLSGGAGLGFSHVGVVKALLAEDLVPEVVSGASAGSIIAALIGTRDKQELAEDLTPANIFEHFSDWSQWSKHKSDSYLDSTNLENALINLFDLMTFEEAYNKTGIHITIPVSPADLHQQSRLLNAKSSPNVIITQAVRASTAIPYLFSPVYLRAKDAQGEVIPYIPHRKFADGSLMADLPFTRLARLYGVNHSIVSQTNPLASPFLANSRHKSNSIGELTVRHSANLIKKNSIYAFDVLERMTSNNTLKLGIHKVRSIIDQQYVGDINILPRRKFSDYRQLFANPTIEGLAQLIADAEKATWPHIDVIMRNTILSKTFRKYLKLLKQQESDLLSHRTATITDIKSRMTN